MLRNLKLYKNRNSDTQVITNLQAEEIDCGCNFRVSAQLVKKSTTDKPIIVINYHADASSEKIRYKERDEISKLITKFKAQYNVSDFIIMGDFNECAYQKNANAMVLNEKLSDIISQISSNIASVGLPPESVLKQRGTIWNGEYLGPNIYLNQQTLKDGEAVLDSKIIILHYDFNEPHKNIDFLLRNENVPQLIKRFDTDKTGGRDHPASELILQGISFKASGYMSTQKHKAFKKTASLFTSKKLTKEMLVLQVRATTKLYQILAQRFLTLEHYNNVDFTNPAAIKDFIKLLSCAIKKNRPQDLEACITIWSWSNAFLAAQSLLKNPELIDPKNLAKKAISTASGEKIIDVIARSLNAQLCGGFMPRVNGQDSPDNDDIDHMHILSTLQQINLEQYMYILNTEGGDSKSEEFTEKLILAINQNKLFSLMSNNRISICHAQARNQFSASANQMSFWKRNFAATVATTLSIGVLVGAALYSRNKI